MATFENALVWLGPLISVNTDSSPLCGNIKTKLKDNNNKTKQNKLKKETVTKQNQHKKEKKNKTNQNLACDQALFFFGGARKCSSARDWAVGKGEKKERKCSSAKVGGRNRRLTKTKNRPL